MAKDVPETKTATIGVLGASGYTGAELVRLLLRHPGVKIALLTADRRAGHEMRDVFPQFAPYALPTLTSIEKIDWTNADLDLAFCALPHGTTQTVSQNQYALTQITYPYGATMSYGYSTFSFFTGGGESVPMAGVSSRAVGGSAMAAGSWSYGYSSPTSGMQTATVNRPDGRQDSYTMFGFGAVASGTTWKVGLTSSMTIGSTQTTSFSWDNRAATPMKWARFCQSICCCAINCK